VNSGHPSHSWVLTMLNKIIEKLDRCSRYFAVAGGWALAGLSLYIGLDVVLRKLFSLSLQGSDEIGGYVLAIICAWGFSYALATKAHIRLTAILAKFPAKVQAIANITAYGALMLLALLMVWRGGAMLLETLEIHAVAPTPLETPLWIPQGLWTLGLLWFFLHVSTYFINAIFLLANGEKDELNKAYGVEKQT
jgi:TRAP-type C4-dicarboxylate transport system permease small subunit